jgi:ABC-type transport system involved in multi-copper enzyme maturation permease subunit
MATLAEKAYVGVVGTALTLVMLVAPAATAGAICLDRSRGTLTHLLATDLTDSEIILGKLAARLVPVLGLVACALPVLALFTLLGGVDPVALTEAFVVICCLAILGCCVALVFSLWVGKTHEALLATYAVWGVWMLGPGILGIVSTGVGAPGFYRWPLSNPFQLALGTTFGSSTHDPGPVLLLAGVTLAVTGALTLVLILRLRRVCCRENGGKRGVAGRGFDRLDRWIRWPGRKWARDIDKDPVRWRECRRSQSSTWGKAFRGFFVVGSILIAALIVAGSRSLDLIIWFTGLHVAIGLLVLSVTAGTSLAEERVRGSLEVLMSTPLTTREIVLGKWWGAYRSVPWLAVLPCLLIVIIADEPLRAWFILPFLVGGILSMGAAVTSVGLAMATWFSRLGRAVAMSVGIYASITIGWVFIVVATCNPQPYGENLLMGSPFAYVAILCAVATSKSDRGSLVAALFWMAVSAVVAWLFRRLTVASFNRCLGRVESRFPDLGRHAVGQFSRGALMASSLTRERMSRHVGAPEEFAL